MRKGSRFLLGFSAAALTFGTLMLTLGPQKFGGHCGGHWKHHHGYSGYHCYDAEGVSESK